MLAGVIVEYGCKQHYYCIALNSANVMCDWNCVSRWKAIIIRIRIGLLCPYPLYIRRKAIILVIEFDESGLWVSNSDLGIQGKRSYSISNKKIKSCPIILMISSSFPFWFPSRFITLVRTTFISWILRLFRSFMPRPPSNVKNTSHTPSPPLSLFFCYKFLDTFQFERFRSDAHIQCVCVLLQFIPSFK